MKFITIKTAIATLTLCAASQAGAQTYPNKGILMVVPLATASATDVVMRIVTQKMGENMGQQITIENIPGAAGMLGGGKVARGAPDGYTLGGLVMRWSTACHCSTRTCRMTRSPVLPRSG